MYMSNELIAILSVGIALAVMMLTQNRNLRADLTKLIEGQAIEIGEIRKDVHALREGLHGLGKRMAHLEGLVEGLKEAVVARFAA